MKTEFINQPPTVLQILMRGLFFLFLCYFIFQDVIRREKKEENFVLREDYEELVEKVDKLGRRIQEQESKILELEATWQGESSGSVGN